VQRNKQHLAARSLFWLLAALPVGLFLLRERLPGDGTNQVIPAAAAIDVIWRTYLWVSPALLLIGAGLYSGDRRRVRLLLLSGLIYAAVLASWMGWQLMQAVGELG
jgi:hypothetical protein